MRRWLIALVALLFVVPAGAQVTVLDDDENDAVTSAGGAAALPNGIYDTSPADLISFSISEEPQSFDFTLEVGDLNRDAEFEGDTTSYYVDFQHADQGYRLMFMRQYFGGQVGYFNFIQKFDSGQQRYLNLADRGDLDVDAGEGTMTVTASRDLFLDGNGTSPTLGREFSLFRAYSRSGLFGNEGFSPLRVDDNMPDTGFGELNYKIQQGLQQTGHAHLYSNNPVRTSNGEEATFVYYIQASNLASQSDRFDLTVAGVPQGWLVTLPASTIRIDENGTQVFPVLVSTPFGHQHGAFESFILRLTSQTDSKSVGQIQVGIRYPLIPQPAGHHDKLWIHARTADATNNAGAIGVVIGGPTEAAYMNAKEDDEGSNDDLVVPPTGYFGGVNSITYEWDIFLEPGLQLGMDFDLNRSGALEVEFTSDVPINDAVLSGTLVHYRNAQEVNGQFRGEETILGDFVSTNPVQINGPIKLETVFTPKKEADLIEYSSRMALGLHLRLTTASLNPFIVQAPETAPKLLPTGELTLPLFEYRDPVEDVFNSLAGIGLQHADKSTKYVNPGETILLNLTLENKGAVDDVFILRVNGTNQDWARLLGDKKVFVATGATRSIVVAVSPPKSALDGDVADLIVTAASEAEPTVQGNARIVAIVDDLLDRGDESHLITAVEDDLTTDKDSPGLPLVLLLAALGTVGLIRRRQN